MRRLLLGSGLAAALVLGAAACSSDGDGDRSASGTSGSTPASSATIATVEPTDFATVAPTTTTTPPTTAAPLAPGSIIPTESTYTIVAGDYPSTVASRFKVSLDDLLALNGLTLQGQMVPGWDVGKVIKIPAGATVPGSTPATTAPSTGGTTAGSTGGSTATTAAAAPTTVDVCAESEYVIVAGDTPSSVAKKFDTTVDALAQVNANTKYYSQFIAGITIKIPAKSDC